MSPVRAADPPEPVASTDVVCDALAGWRGVVM
jgi:hypothetical protein